MQIFIFVFPFPFSPIEPIGCCGGDPDEDDEDEDDDEEDEEAAPAKVSQRPGPSRPRGHDKLQKAHSLKIIKIGEANI